MSVKKVKALINGQEVSLTYNAESGLYEATVTAPSASSYPLDGHFYPVEITAQDNAGNVTSVNTSTPTIGDNLKLFVKELIKPTAQITYPTNGAYITNSMPKIEFTLLDNANGQSTGYSGIDTSKTVLEVGGKVVPVSAITFTETPGGYKGTYTPTEVLPDGNVVVRVTAGDFDDNISETAQSSFKIDTVDPTLSVTAPVDGFATNNSQLTVEGTTNDATSSPVTVNILLNGVDQGAVTVNADGSFSKNISLTEQGINVIKVVVTDRAGRTNEVERTIEFSTTAPVISNITITPNPVDHNKTFKISCKVL